MSRFYRSVRSKLAANESGQAMVELAFLVILLLMLVSASIEFGRALYTMQVMAQLSRQGSNLASRDDTLSNAVAAVIAGESGLNIAVNGEVIITEIENTGTTASPTYTMVGQASSGGISEASHVGTYVSGGGNTATMPGGYITGTLQANQYTWVTEIFYKFSAITPIGALTNHAVSMPSLLYDYTYF
jgi:Flp pilus assembly protein TadG